MEKTGESVKIKKIAVTGGIASGKTTVCDLLAKSGAYVVIADELVHSLLQNDLDCIHEIQRSFGSAIIGQTGQIDRSKLAKIVFNQPLELEKLEAVVHPRVVREIQKTYESLRNEKKPPPAFVVEFPLLFEIGFDSWFDTIIYVKTKPEIAQKRFVEKGFPKEMYEKRSLRLLPSHEKEKKATIVIENNASKTELAKTVTQMIEALT